MKWNAWLLPFLLASSLSAVYFLPKSGEVAKSAVKMELPDTVGVWSFNKMPASEMEIKVLGPETKFSKAICLQARPGEMNLEGHLIPDRVDLSIVLSGYDLNNSIHRPERCMPAQGHNITNSSDVRIKMPNGHEFEIKRLRSVQTIKDPKTEKVAAQFNCVTYYFFVGHDQITNDHLQRTFFDMKDRMVRGMDQRWAYVSVSMWFGKVPWIEKEVSEAEADEKIKAFVIELTKNQVDWQQVKR
ncbi:MAG: exosortase-associated EpsI family protein [Gloeobacteraceae cyanobacterium ES-bin-144]|nr:exosortase-associated EpsI family protein [Verrucomicrobiales bacterium]